MKRLVLIALGVGACMGHSKFPSLSQADQARYKRCMMPLRQNRCPNPTSEFALAFCERSSQDEYSEIPGDRDRLEWLVANGCPPSMVQPERYVDAPTDRPMPRKQPPAAQPAPQADGSAAP